MIKAKKSGAGHKMCKVCRRVLLGPIVKEDTYCLELVGKELRGEGERNAAGEEEGRGTMVFASGNMYEGQWLAGKQHGQGKYTFAYTYDVGSSYDGEWVEGKKHGTGTYTYANGEVEVGCYEADTDVGQGVKWSADRAEAWELQDGEEVCSISLDGNRYEKERIPLDEAATIAERIHRAAAALRQSYRALRQSYRADPSGCRRPEADES